MLMGFVVLVSMKKSMETKLAFIKENQEGEKSSIKSKSIIWWIRGVTAWGIGAIFLVVWWFQNSFG